VRTNGILAVVVALAAGLRWFRIDAQSLWYDEAVSAHQLTRSFAEILRAASLDTQPPLYYWALAGWGHVFGGSELSLRSLSAVAGVAIVVLTFFTGRRLFGTLAGAVAALLIATAPLAVYYSQEVRMYAQVTALGLLAVYAYTRRTYWLYIVAGLATLYSQYLGVAVLAALNLHALIWWRERTQGEWIKWLAANAAIAIGFLPWLPTFIDQQSHALNTSPRTPLGLLEATLAAYGGGIAHGDVYTWAGTALVVLSIVGLALNRDWEANSMALLVWVLPLGLVIGLAVKSGLYEVRYLLVGLPGLVLLAGLGVAQLARKHVSALSLVIVTLVPAGLALWAQYYDPALARDDYRGLVGTISEAAQPGDAILLVAPGQMDAVTYYYHGALPIIGLPAQRPIDPRDTIQRLDTLRQQHNRVWLVAWAMNEADPNGVIADWLAQNGFQATHEWFGGVQLALIGFPSPDQATQPVDANLDNGIVLDGYRLSSRTLHPGDTLGLTLIWRAANGPTSDSWKVFTHLLNGASQVVAQRDSEPGDNLRPTTSWRPGEQIEDNYGITIPADLPAGSYTLEIGMYDGEKRSVFDGHGDHLVLGDVRVLQ